MFCIVTSMVQQMSCPKHGYPFKNTGLGLAKFRQSQHLASLAFCETSWIDEMVKCLERQYRCGTQRCGLVGNCIMDDCMTRDVVVLRLSSRV
jgi:hypothetical protein